MDAYVSRWYRCNASIKKIIHRDLKPENLFLDDQDRLIIGGFGVSIQKTICLSLVGTVGYFAPEYLVGEGYTKSADMWSVGCLLLDLLTFTTARDVLQMTTKKRIASIPTSYSKKWNKIVNDLLNENPQTRMTAMGLKKALLEMQGQRKGVNWLNYLPQF